mmetsp:Transcript_39981/g.103469  ORF Transcript_39981/g.103469 Transcript_39981/m.103469 type:complete len:244 (-) Transcript_39981:134-865(-)
MTIQENCRVLPEAEEAVELAVARGSNQLPAELPQLGASLPIAPHGIPHRARDHAARVVPARGDASGRHRGLQDRSCARLGGVQQHLGHGDQQGGPKDGVAEEPHGHVGLQDAGVRAARHVAHRSGFAERGAVRVHAPLQLRGRHHIHELGVAVSEDGVVVPLPLNVVKLEVSGLVDRGGHENNAAWGWPLRGVQRLPPLLLRGKHVIGQEPVAQMVDLQMDLVTVRGLRPGHRRHPHYAGVAA